MAHWHLAQSQRSASTEGFPKGLMGTRGTGGCSWKCLGLGEATLQLVVGFPLSCLKLIADYFPTPTFLLDGPFKDVFQTVFVVENIFTRAMSLMKKKSTVPLKGI